MIQVFRILLCSLWILLPAALQAQESDSSQSSSAVASSSPQSSPEQVQQDAPESGNSKLEAQLAEALQLLKSQQQTLEQQKQLLTQQGERIDRLQAEIDDMRNPVTVLPDKPADTKSDTSTDATANKAAVASAVPADRIDSGPAPGGEQTESAPTTAVTTPTTDAGNAAAERAAALVAEQQSDSADMSSADDAIDSSANTPTNRIVAVTEEAQGAQEDDPTRDLLQSLPGAMRLPGTNAVMRIGGYVKTDYVQSFDPLAIDNKFITGSIPVSPEQEEGVEAQNVITVEQSRLSIDLREPTDVGLVRAFIEGDFAGSNNTFRLRHAFGQRGNVLAGKTWSGFVDRTASPEEIDFEGLNARISVRQAQVRIQPGIGQKYELALSLEDPNPEVTNGKGVNRLPDFVASGRINWGGSVHARLALLLRQVRAQWDGGDGGTEKKNGWGVSFSGRIDTPWLDPRDNVLFQLNVGNGYGRYVNDLNSVGNFDGIFSDTGELKLIEVLAGYVAVQHWWGGTMRSTATLGLVHLNNPDIAPDDFYKNTWRSSINLIWSPTPRVEVGTELLWGRRENENGNQGDASQLQIAGKYLF